MKHRIAKYTLVELLVVVSVIGILTMLLMSAMKVSQERAKEMECKDKLKAIGISVGEFTYDNQMDIPEGAAIGSWSWDRHYIAELAPYLGYEHLLYPQARYSQSFWYRRVCGQGTDRFGAPEILRCPSDSTDKGTDYAWNWKYLQSVGQGEDRSRKKLKYGRVLYWRSSTEETAAVVSDQAIMGDNHNGTSVDMGRPYSPGSNATRHRIGGNYLFYDFHVDWRSLESISTDESHWTFWRAVEKR